MWRTQKVFEFDMLGVHPEKFSEFDMLGVHPERFFTFDLFGVHPERFFEFDMLGVHPDRELYPQKITPTRYFTCFMLRFTPTKTKAFLVTPTGLGGTPTGRESTPTGRGAPRAVFGPRSGQ